MPQGCWFEGTLMFDVKFEFHEKTGKGRAFFKLRVPANYQKKDAEKEMYDGLAFEAWDDVAETCSEWKQGERMVVVGRAGSYSVDKEDGKKDYRMKLIAERVYRIQPNETAS